MGLSDDDDDHCQSFSFSHEIPFKFKSNPSNVQQQIHTLNSIDLDDIFLFLPGLWVETKFK